MRLENPKTELKPGKVRASGNPKTGLKPGKAEKGTPVVGRVTEW